MDDGIGFFLAVVMAIAAFVWGGDVGWNAAERTLAEDIISGTRVVNSYQYKDGTSEVRIEEGGNKMKTKDVKRREAESRQDQYNIEVDELFQKMGLTVEEFVEKRELSPYQSDRLKEKFEK